MDPVSLSVALTQNSVSTQVGVSVLRSIDGLDKTLAAQLFASIGLGSQVDASA